MILTGSGGDAVLCTGIQCAVMVCSLLPFNSASSPNPPNPSSSPNSEALAGGGMCVGLGVVGQCSATAQGGR